MEGRVRKSCLEMLLIEISQNKKSEKKINSVLEMLTKSIHYMSR